MSHYFESPEEDSDGKPHFLELAVNDKRIELKTGAGVFSRTRLDPGTAVLLRKVPAPPTHGNLLDLGCGYGPIALTMALLAPKATIWAIDINSRARELCAYNAAQAGVTNIRVLAPEEVPADIKFAAIWSNPPIRVGKQALHELLTNWLSRLEPKGEAYLVVQRHLGADSLQEWLSEQGWPTDRIGSKQGFRVLRAHSLKID